MKVKHKFDSLISGRGRSRNGPQGWLNHPGIWASTILVSIVLLIGCVSRVGWGHLVRDVSHIIRHSNVPVIDLAGTGITNLGDWACFTQEPVLKRAGVVQIRFSCEKILLEVTPDWNENQLFGEYKMLETCSSQTGLLHCAYMEPDTANYKSAKEKCWKIIKAIEFKIDGKEIDLSAKMFLYETALYAFVILEVGTHTVNLKDTRTGKTASCEVVVDKNQPFIRPQCKWVDIITKNLSGSVFVDDIQAPAERLGFLSYDSMNTMPFSLEPGPSM